MSVHCAGVQLYCEHFPVFKFPVESQRVTMRLCSDQQQSFPKTLLYDVHKALSWTHGICLWQEKLAVVHRH